MTERATPSTPAAPRSVADRILGLLGGGMVLAAVVLLLVGGEPDTGATSVLAAPAIELIQPRDGAAVSGRPNLVFSVPQDLQRKPGGWGLDSVHLHLELDGREFMPGPSDIERLPTGHYRWTLPPLDPGAHALRLYWSGPDHRPLARGGSSTVRVTVN